MGNPNEGEVHAERSEHVTPPAVVGMGAPTTTVDDASQKVGERINGLVVLKGEIATDEAPNGKTPTVDEAARQAALEAAQREEEQRAHAARAEGFKEQLNALLGGDRIVYTGPNDKTQTIPMIGRAKYGPNGSPYVITLAYVDKGTGEVTGIFIETGGAKMHVGINDPGLKEISELRA